MDSDDLIWIDKTLRVIAVIVAVLALPLILFVAIMSGGAPWSGGNAVHLMKASLLTDGLVLFTSFLPMPVLPLSKWGWARFGLIRIPSYSVAPTLDNPDYKDLNLA